MDDALMQVWGATTQIYMRARKGKMKLSKNIYQKIAYSILNNYYPTSYGGNYATKNTHKELEGKLSRHNDRTISL